ncbi:hypothetical protein ACHHYP_11266 [Achlya hypogyna]|uniref:Transmembrane protein n=1 Tax=Achlya hypogyna TaxID=1202772 RepID=A0A1V9YJG6_ACHHY|nr:hypothetical protein ACHHYP_11266 [Achlya hypogyna]
MVPLASVAPSLQGACVRRSVTRYRRRHRLLAVGFLTSCVWNICAPVKAWLLTRYGFVSTNDIATVSLEWHTVLNGRLLTALYSAAGIALSGPMAPTRYINVFLDFVISPRSHLSWAASFDGSINDFQMDIEGQAYRCSLNGTAERAQFARDVAMYTTTGYSLWGSERIFNYIPPQDGPTNLHEVTEAVLCLKGMTPEDYVNVEFKSLLNPYTNESDAAAIATWRQGVFPNLTACLARRAALLATAMSPAAGLTILATELASMYDLGLTNIAGSQQLYQPVTFLDGFMDLSGAKSGAVTYQISGPDPMHTLSASSGFLDSMLSAREAAWWCSIQYLDPATQQRNITKCFAQFASTLPAFFLGKYLTVNSGTRYLDNNAFVAAATNGSITAYNYRRRLTARLEDIEYVTPGNLTAWNDLWKQLIATVAGPSMVTPTDALEEICFVGDGCFDVCANASASGGSTLTFKRGGGCVAALDTIAHVLSDLYVDLKCFGLGSGTDNVLVTYMGADGIRRQVVAPATASPVAIWTCLIGGRAPQSEFPSYVVELLSQGTQATLVLVKTDGSDSIMLNFISLVALVGYAYFSAETILALFRIWRWHRRLPDRRSRKQRYYSVVNSSVASAIWARHRLAMRCVGFLNFIAWHIGAARMSCAWTPAILDVATDAAYECRVDVWGHVASASEGVRLVSISWVFFALVFLDRMPGIGIEVRGYAVVWALLGLLPLTVLAGFVAAVCLWRIQAGYLEWVHNQLFVLLVWTVVIGVLRCHAIQSRLLSGVGRVLRLIGVYKQLVDKESPFYDLVGDHFWIERLEWRPAPATYLPLSVLLESPAVRLEDITDHEYFACGLGADAREHGSRLENHPSWLLEAYEYYVCVHECEILCYGRHCAKEEVARRAHHKP